MRRHPDFRVLHFAHESVLQHFDGLSWMSLSTFTGPDHKDRAIAALLDHEEAIPEGCKCGPFGELHGGPNPECPIHGEERGSASATILFGGALIALLMVILPLLTSALHGLSATNL